MFRIPLLVIAVLAVECVGWQRVLANDEEDAGEFAVSALRAVNDIAWSKMTVRIVDSEGKPIEGAVVRPWALRAGGGHGPWREDAYGAPRRTKTNAGGEADVVYPQSVAWSESHPVVLVSLFVSHQEFCTKNAHVDVPGGDPLQVRSVTLDSGVRLRVAGVEPRSDRPLTHCHVLLEGGETDETEFVPEADGWMQSIPVRENRRWFRVVRTPPGEPPQFSKPIAWTPDDPASLVVRAEVRPGVHVMGKVSDAVSRPIVRGHVVAWCGSPSPRGADDGRGRTEPIWWIDTVPIREDGSFEFPSLPSGYLAQIYALANDSISSQPSDEAYKTCCEWFAVENRERTEHFRHGQILRLAGSKSQITLDMEPAGQVRVKCVDATGLPLARVHVSSWPNQYMVAGGSTIFCIPQSSLDRLRGTRRTDWSRDNPFAVETDANGEGVIRNLPQGNQSLVAGNDRWVSKQEQKIESTPGKTATITMMLKRRP